MTFSSRHVLCFTVFDLATVLHPPGLKLEVGFQSQYSLKPVTHKCIQISDPLVILDGPYGEVKRIIVDIDKSEGIFPNLFPHEYLGVDHVELAAKVFRYDPKNKERWNLLFRVGLR